MVKISVLIPVYNGQRYIKETIKSVLNQTFDDYEIIVIDDGSDDSTLKVVNSLKEKKIRVMKHKENRGQGTALNTGLKNAKGDYVQYLDCDDVLVNFKFDVHSKLLDLNKDVAMIYSDGWKMNEKGEIFGYLSSNIADIEILKRRNYIIASTVMFRKSVIETIEGFPEDLEAALDWDMWLRICERFSSVYTPFPTLLYRVRDDSKSAISKKTRKIERTRKEVIKRALKRDLKLKKSFQIAIPGVKSQRMVSSLKEIRR